jgi:hypothetical protein
MVQALDHIQTAVTISEEDEPNLYHSDLKRKMIGRVSVCKESGEKREKSSIFISLYFHQNAFSGITPAFNIMRKNSAS